MIGKFMRMKILRPVMAALVAAAAACGSGEKPSAPTGAPARAPRVDAATAGAIVGRVSFEGTPPANPRVKVSGDPVCVRANADGMTFEHYVVKDGGLDNVFVYVKAGLGSYHFDIPSEPVKVDQQGCRYVPYMLGARVGQPVEISNSDETTHNVHSLPETNREFNYAQFKRGQKNVETFTVAEVMIPLKCDLHGWMRAYLGVVEHPYFAVTADGGKFELKNVPPGTYTIEAWHEKAGTQTRQITVAQKETKEIGFTYKATSTN
jgi:plastocyanin